MNEFCSDMFYILSYFNLLVYLILHPSLAKLSLYVLMLGYAQLYNYCSDSYLRTSLNKGPVSVPQLFLHVMFWCLALCDLNVVSSIKLS